MLTFDVRFSPQRFRFALIPQTRARPICRVSHAKSADLALRFGNSDHLAETLRYGLDKLAASLRL